MKRTMLFVSLAALCVSVFSCVAYSQESEPAVVSALEGKIPSDAIVLFDGKDLSKWTSIDGTPAKFEVKDGAMVVVKGSGGVVTKDEFGSMQIHIEFATPAEAKGEGQDRGNSGVYIQGIYETQVLDCFNNKTYINGMVGAVYNEYPPLVNACRPAGQWQTYDIIFHAVKFGYKNNIDKRATVTVLLNGVLVQDNVEIVPTPGGPRTKEALTGPIYLQDHGHPVKYRNIWVRKI